MPGMIFAGIYLLLVGIVFASEFHTRVFDRGNSEMAGMVTYLLTMPSSILVDWLAKTLFGVGVGDTDLSFTLILSFSALLNAVLIFLLISLLAALARRM
jgi:hypothetical protein